MFAGVREISGRKSLVSSIARRPGLRRVSVGPLALAGTISAAALAAFALIEPGEEGWETGLLFLCSTTRGPARKAPCSEGRFLRAPAEVSMPPFMPLSLVNSISATTVNRSWWLSVVIGSWSSKTWGSLRKHAATPVDGEPAQALDLAVGVVSQEGRQGVEGIYVSVASEGKGGGLWAWLQAMWSRAPSLRVQTLISPADS